MILVPDSYGEVIFRDFGFVEYCEYLGMGKVCRCFAMYSDVGCARRVFRKVQRARNEQLGRPREQQPHLLPNELSCALCLHVGHYRVNPFFLYACEACHLRSLLCSISALRFYGCSLFPFCFTSSIPFVVVPRPFIIGDYRITPSCIVLGTAACRYWIACSW